MVANTNYNDKFTINRVISVIQKLHPEKEIGNYVAHAPSNDGRGIMVKLTNGKILVSHTAIEDIDFANEIPDYADFMISTFEQET